MKCQRFLTIKKIKDIDARSKIDLLREMWLPQWLSKESVCNAGYTEDSGSNPESGISPREGNSNPLQHSCLKSPLDRRAWWATVHGVEELDTLSDSLAASNEKYAARTGI